MLVADLKTALKKYGFNDSDPLLLWLNESYHTIEIERKKWTWLEQVEEGEITSEGIPNGEFKLLTSAKRIVKIRDVTDEQTGSLGSGEDLEYVTLSQYERDFYSQRSSGNPEFFTIRAQQEIIVWPVPTTSRQLKITFIAELEDLKEDTEEPQMPEAYHYCIVMGAAYIALMSENEEERANTAQAQFEAKLGKLVEDDMERQIGEPDFVEYVED